MSEKIKLLLTEDLSPHRISLLFLIKLYCSNQIPQERLRSILNILIKFLEHDTIYDEFGERVIIPTLSDLLFNLKKATGGISNEKTASVEGDSLDLQRLLLHSLWKIQSVEDLDFYVSSLENILVKSTVATRKPSEDFKHISARSFLGSFIQKTTTAFKLLEFDEVFILLESFVDYRESSREIFKAKGGTINVQKEASSKYMSILPSKIIERNDIEFSSTSTDDELLFKRLNSQLSDAIGVNILNLSQSTEKDNTKLLSVPKQDLQNLLEGQIHLLEMYGTRTPQRLKDIMFLMTSPDSNTCSIQNINFNNLPSYYYVQYLENLKESDYKGAFKSLHQYFDYMVSNNSKYFYHFALISRASLHQFFGEDEKAIDAIEEAISVARENKDNITLTYILSWLFNFLKNKPGLWKRQSFYNNNDESQLLNFLIQKSQSVSLSLYALSYNFETLQILNSGGTMNRYLESLLKGTFISINDQISSFIKSTELSATVWSRIGVPCLSDVYNDLSIKSTDKRTDKISIQIRSNFLRFLKGETELAYQNLEKLKAEVNYDHSLYSSVQIRSLIMLIKLNLLKGRYRLSKEIIETLLDNDIKEIGLKEEITLLQIEIEIAMENYSEALMIIADQLSDSSSSNLYLMIKLNLLKCKIFNKSGCPSRGLTLIIQQIQQGKKIGFKTIVVEGLVLLVSMLNNMKYYDDSYKILNQIMPTVLSVDNKELTSHGYYEFARACFELYKQKIGNSTLFNSILKYLNLSILGFKGSINLVMLTECFKLEDEMAQFKGDISLINHAKSSIEKLEIRAKEESDYGYVFKK